MLLFQNCRKMFILVIPFRRQHGMSATLATLNNYVKIWIEYLKYYFWGMQRIPLECKVLFQDQTIKLIQLTPTFPTCALGCQLALLARKMFANKIYNKMSVEKLKIFKKLKANDAYSKNPILDSLIKQKLQSEMVIIKDNFNTLIQREDAREKQPLTERQPKKRRLSSQNLASLTSQKIKESIAFNHQRDREVTQFIINRQKSSPFLDIREIDALNTARTYNEELQTKMKESDKLNYQTFGFKGDKIDEDYQINLIERLKKMVPPDVWPLEQPQIKEIIESRSQRMELSPKKTAASLKLNLNNRPSSHHIQPLMRSRSNIMKKMPSTAQLQPPEITYDPNKFHKSDYLSLQKWLQNTIEQMNGNHAKSISSNKNYVQEITSHLNGIYTIYMSALKEVIRLTYIQSGQKGLLLQKIIWSFVRLFEDLISEQHKINYEQFKQSSRQLKESRELYETRIKLLQNALREKESTIANFSQTKRNIVMSSLTYKKVNEGMLEEIQTLVKEMKSLHHQNDYLMNNLRKLINQFEKRQQIKIQKNQNYNIYFYLNQKNEIEVVAKVPRQELLQKYFEGQMKQTAIHKIEQQLAQQTNNVDKLQNELTQYWQKKKTYLQIDKIIQENFISDINETGMQTNSNGPLEYAEMSTQFPEENEQTFEDFLKRQLVEQRQNWSKKESQLKEVSISLKEVYDEARESITMLTAQNVTLKQNIDQKDHEIIYLKRKIEQVEEKANIFNKKIALLQKDLETSKAEIEGLNEQTKRANDKYLDQKKKVMFERENNNILAEGNYRLKQKCQEIKVQFESLEQKIKILAPHLQKTMVLAQSSQNPILLKLTQLIQQHLSNYVQRDAQVFLTH